MMGAAPNDKEKNNLKKLALTLMVVATGLFGFAAIGTSATAESQGKVFVCKYVGTPGVNETLQTGDNPISVSVNAIPIYDANDPNFDSAADLVGEEFADAQGRSLIIAEDVGQAEPTCPPPTTTTTPPPTTTTSPPPTQVPPPCEPDVRFGPWYGDPRINITLEGPGRFVVKGGIQRFSDTRVFRVRLECDETFRISRYKVKYGHTLYVYLNGVLHDQLVAPTGLGGH